MRYKEDGKMCKVIAITNQKGGCAKTNVTVNLGIGLAREGKKVALIDKQHNYDFHGIFSHFLKIWPKWRLRKSPR